MAKHINVVLADAVEVMRKTADQMDRWIRECIIGGWSTNLVEPMKQEAHQLRQKALAFECQISEIARGSQ